MWIFFYMIHSPSDYAISSSSFSSGARAMRVMGFVEVMVRTWNGLDEIVLIGVAIKGHWLGLRG